MDLHQIPEPRTTVSDDQQTRLTLSRCWDSGPIILAIGLNPSHATATRDDPTTRRLTVLLGSAGYGGFVLLNLWTEVNPDPRTVIKKAGHWGEADWARFEHGLAHSSHRLWMWGARGKSHPDLSVIVAADPDALCFGWTRSGMPKHPLYLPKNSPLSRYADRGQAPSSVSVDASRGPK